MAQAKEFARDNVGDIATELLNWRDTGLLVDGKLRELASMLRPISANDSLSVAEGMARDAALEDVVDRYKAPEPGGPAGF